MAPYRLQNDDQIGKLGKSPSPRTFGPSGLLAMVLLLSTFIGAQQVKSEIVGQWICAKSLKGNGFMLYFKPDGSLTMSPGRFEDVPCQINGDKFVGPRGNDNLSFRIEGNALYVRVEEQREVKFERVSKPKPGDPPMVGTWKLVVDVKPPPEIKRADSTYTYTRDGVCKVRVHFITVAGTYNPANSRSGTFTVTLERRQTFSYRIADSKLYLKWPDGKAEDVYVRENNE